jgi:predicted 2-oxoglutarate/Fe(II)-dependent dioxygenase YbiX
MMNDEGTLLADDRSIFTIGNVLSLEECDGFIQFTERAGFAAAPIGGGTLVVPAVRNNARRMIDDPALSAELWGRLARSLPESWYMWRVVGLNERFRYYRYDVGEYFRWHRDGAFVRSRFERSLFTAMIYLNDDFEGGTTDFEAGLSITPRRGMALLFQHSKLHQGAAVTRGRKYVLRTDVMYRRS